MAVKLSPLFNEASFDGNGDPLSGGLLYTYVAGSTTPQATYQESTGTTAHANPIVLDSRGEPSAPIWLAQGALYKFVLKDSSGVTIRTIDNVSGVNDTDASAVDEWQLYAGTPTYVSGTSFTLVGDQTTEFHANRRLKTINSGGTIYSTISSSSYSSPNTTVNVTNDSGSLDAGLSSVYYGLLRAANTSFPAGLIANVPTGAVLPYAGASAPAGFLLCDGSAVSRTTYSALFAIVSTTYGVGDGSTTFNLPDLTGRTVFGKESSATRLTGAISGMDSTNLGETGGHEDTQQHNHTATDSGHVHSLGATYDLLTGSATGGYAAGAKNVASVSQTASGAASITVQNDGTGDSGNIPPALIMNWVVKT